MTGDGPVNAASVVLPAVWSAMVLAGAWRRRPAPARVRSLRPPAGPVDSPVSAGTPAGAGSPGSRLGPSSGPGLLRRASAVAGRAAGRLPLFTGLWGRDRPPDEERLGRALLAGAAALPVMAMAAPAIGLMVWAMPVVGARRSRRKAEARLRSALPEAVDLFRLAVASGLTVPLAITAVGTRARDPVGAELRRVAHEVGLGHRVGDSLDALATRLGPPARPLVGALLSSERYGAPLAATLDRLADEVRRDRQRRAEEAARRVPVKLLFPLVLCSLPAFALLTVVPLVAGTLSTLRL